MVPKVNALLRLEQEISNDDRTPVVARVFCHAKIADFLYPREAPKRSVTGDGCVTVLIAPWAASADALNAPKPALPAPPRVGSVL